MIQSFLPGAPRARSWTRSRTFPKDTHGLFFRQLGWARLPLLCTPWWARTSGPVAGPGHACWSRAVVASLRQIADDVEECGLDAADLRRTADIAQAGAHRLDEVGEPGC
ncbi:hypothetical protein ACFCYC_08500 [Streptomyces sp. NPDC056402]|uniref:hypothetical protein n=1 Tax=Streptomyces sp. NPDC056402 TaxID=3345810 RepID=UPI0035D56130